MRRILSRVALVGGSIGAGWTAWLLACGPFGVDLQPVVPRVPADAAAYARGDMDVVRPDFAQRYRIQA